MLASPVAKLSLDLSNSPLTVHFPDHLWNERRTHEHEGNTEDEASVVSTSEEVVASLEAMTASTFVNIPPHLLQPDRPSPSPIRMPTSIGNNKNETSDPISSSAPALLPSGSPAEDAASVKSGITLARALFSNSFALSDSERHASASSSVLTRHDSATLAPGEHPLNAMGGGGNSNSRQSHSRSSSGLVAPPVPPVPPLPAAISAPAALASASVASPPTSPLPAVPHRSTIPPHLVQRATQATSSSAPAASPPGRAASLSERATLPPGPSTSTRSALATSSRLGGYNASSQAADTSLPISPRRFATSPLGVEVPPAPPMPPDPELLFSQISGILSPPTSYAGSSRAQSMLSSRTQSWTSRTDSWQSSAASPVDGANLVGGRHSEESKSPSERSGVTSGSAYSQSSPSGNASEEEPTMSFGRGSQDTHGTRSPWTDETPSTTPLPPMSPRRSERSATRSTPSPALSEARETRGRQPFEGVGPTVFAPPVHRATVTRASLVKVDSRESETDGRDESNARPVTAVVDSTPSTSSPTLSRTKPPALVPMKPTFTEIVARMDFRPTFTPISEEGSLLSLKSLSQVATPMTADKTTSGVADGLVGERDQDRLTRDSFELPPISPRRHSPPDLPCRQSHSSTSAESASSSRGPSSPRGSVSSGIISPIFGTSAIPLDGRLDVKRKRESMALGHGRVLSTSSLLPISDRPTSSQLMRSGSVPQNHGPSMQSRSPQVSVPARQRSVTVAGVMKERQEAQSKSEASSSESGPSGMALEQRKRSTTISHLLPIPTVKPPPVPSGSTYEGARLRSSSVGQPPSRPVPTPPQPAPLRPSRSEFRRSRSSSSDGRPGTSPGSLPLRIDTQQRAPARPATAEGGTGYTNFWDGPHSTRHPGLYKTLPSIPQEVSPAASPVKDNDHTATNMFQDVIVPPRAAGDLHGFSPSLPVFRRSEEVASDQSRSHSPERQQSPVRDEPSKAAAPSVPEQSSRKTACRIQCVGDFASDRQPAHPTPSLWSPASTSIARASNSRSGKQSRSTTRDGRAVAKSSSTRVRHYHRYALHIIISDILPFAATSTFDSTSATAYFNDFASTAVAAAASHCGACTSTYCDACTGAQWIHSQRGCEKSCIDRGSGYTQSSGPSSESPSGQSLLGSPPPYHVVCWDCPPPQGDEDERNHRAQRSQDEPPPTDANEAAPLPSTASTEGSFRRVRVRPPLPAGPRMPSIRRRADTLPSSGSRRRRLRSSAEASDAVHHSPISRTPSSRWPAYTLDGAKLVFTSEQLQSTVSQAIRHSAQASSIRLLRPEDVETKIPVELSRLEERRMDIKAQFASLKRARDQTLSSLASMFSSTEAQGSGSHLVQELRNVSARLDKLCEDLHTTDERIAELSSLLEAHQSSALSVALRKLNGSFQRRCAELNRERERAKELEAERDEAWQHASAVAKELDEMCVKVEGSTPGSSRRSSRVIASRKSSLRVSKAGLRPSSSSRRTSTISFGGYSSDDDGIPPVPHIPRLSLSPTASRRRRALSDGAIGHGQKRKLDASAPLWKHDRLVRSRSVPLRASLAAEETDVRFSQLV
ncbi:hypothetical protein K525DRAFT_276507 [Schizophyllum commune Loenen D]|nr:hypothetical protein K525DRAFT_276507 [Schizophyllum commune Loenen D]